jgi:hypothetical protein
MRYRLRKDIAPSILEFSRTANVRFWPIADMSAIDATRAFGSRRFSAMPRGRIMSVDWYMALVFVSPLLQNLILAWAFTAITNGNSSTFWTAFVTLIGIRLFFTVVDSLFSVLSFTFYRKKFVVQQLVNDFRRFEFPKREDLNEDWLAYLKRLQETESLPFTVRRTAAFLEGQCELADKSGFVMGRQSEAVMEAAVNAWSTTPLLAVRSQREADEREY